jgi:hypothetical protein
MLSSLNFTPAAVCDPDSIRGTYGHMEQTCHDELEHTSSTRFFGYLDTHFCDSIKLVANTFRQSWKRGRLWLHLVFVTPLLQYTRRINHVIIASLFTWCLMAWTCCVNQYHPRYVRNYSAQPTSGERDNRCIENSVNKEKVSDEKSERVNVDEYIDSVAATNALIDAAIIRLFQIYLLIYH